MLSEMVPSYNFSVRFKEIADALEGNVSANTDIGARGSLYQVSINAFLSNPIFGAGDKNLYVDYGNHSTILDAFAKYGLLGGSLNLLYFYKPISCVKLHLSETSKSIYNICLPKYIMMLLKYSKMSQLLIIKLLILTFQ